MPNAANEMNRIKLSICVLAEEITKGNFELVGIFRTAIARIS